MNLDLYIKKSDFSKIRILIITTLKMAQTMHVAFNHVMEMIESGYMEELSGAQGVAEVRDYMTKKINQSDSQHGMMLLVEMAGYDLVDFDYVYVYNQHADIVHYVLEHHVDKIDASFACGILETDKSQVAQYKLHHIQRFLPAKVVTTAQDELSNIFNNMKM